MNTTLSPYEYNVLLKMSGANLTMGSIRHGAKYPNALHTLLRAGYLRAGYLRRGTWDYKISTKGKEYLAAKQPKDCA